MGQQQLTVIIDREYGTLDEPWSISTTDDKFLSRHGTPEAAIFEAKEKGYYIEYVDM